MIKQYILILLGISLCFSQKRVPAEWETQEAIWLQWPMQVEHWYRPEMAEVIAIIHLLVQNNSQLSQAQNQILSQGGSLENLTFHIQAHENAWLRDNGPVWIEVDNQQVIQDMVFDGWGGAVNDYDNDDLIPCIMADWLNLLCEKLDFIMEQGNLEFNGAGDLLINWDCWHDRNPSYSQAQSDAVLMEAFGVTNVVWTIGFSLMI